MADRNRAETLRQTSLEANKPDEALAHGLRKVELEREILRAGELNGVAEDQLNNRRQELAASVDWLARQYERRGDIHSLHTCREETLGLCMRVFGPDNWRTTDARLELEHAKILSSLTASQRTQLAEAQRLLDQGRASDRTEAREDYLRGIQQVQQCLEIRKGLLGDQHPDIARAIHEWATLCRGIDEYENAKQLYRKGLNIRKNTLGELHPETAQSLNDLATMTYFTESNHAPAEALWKESLEIRRKVLGERHADTAVSLQNLGAMYEQVGEYDKAEIYYQKSLSISTEILGREHPDRARTVANLGDLCRVLGDYAKAEAKYNEALGIYDKVFGKDHARTVFWRRRLGALYLLMGDYAKAQPIFLECLEINSQLGDLGGTADCQHHLGWLYSDMGDYAKAEPFYRQSLEACKTIWGEESTETARIRNDLANLYSDMGEYAKAESLHKQNLGIYREVLGEQHRDTAMSLNNLANQYFQMDDYEKAEPLYRQSLKIMKEVLGEQHRDTADSLNNVACLYHRRGEFATAESLYRKSLDIYRVVLGKQHPDTAFSEENLSKTMLAQGRNDEAADVVHVALTSCRELLNATAAVQTERQQLLINKKLRDALDLWLSAAQGAVAYADVLRWKGTVFVRQADSRALRNQPELKHDVEQLRAVSSRLAKVALAIPKEDQRATHRRQLGELTRNRVALERRISQKSVVYRETRDLAALTPARLQATLPEKTALVDLLEYERFVPRPGEQQESWSQRHVVAFVVRRDQPIKRLELGSADSISKLIDRWHRIARRSSNSPATEPARQLRELIWKPLETHLQGVETLLVSPDGCLGKLPFAALPGKKPETYLLEELAVVVVPVPQTLFTLLQPGTHANESADADEVEASDQLSMLVLGGIDYDGEVAKPSTTRKRRRRAGEGLQFFNLHGTRGEALFIQDTFRNAEPDGRLSFLSGERATEEMVRKLAPQSHFLHFATHGFFAPAKLVSALDSRADENSRGVKSGVEQHKFMGYHPGLLSGLALSGANKPRHDGDDGVLTALEVAEMDLSQVRLAVLSACETGLGRVAGGEGLLGLQRSFQLAGAQRVVASLWKVDDEVTRAMMEQFYKNYWTTDLDTIECLRQAQLWMLESDKHRGLDRKREGEPTVKNPRVAPEYWGAFVLSGDWR